MKNENSSKKWIFAFDEDEGKQVDGSFSADQVEQKSKAAQQSMKRVIVELNDNTKLDLDTCLVCTILDGSIQLGLHHANAEEFIEMAYSVMSAVASLGLMDELTKYSMAAMTSSGESLARL